MSAITAHRSQKATRRSSDRWSHGQPQPRGLRRVPTLERKPEVIRFPNSAPASSESNAVSRRLSSVQATWSLRERELRRMEAIRKQQELLMLLADAELEDGLRLAVADGEQPVLPPEIEVLRN